MGVQTYDPHKVIITFGGIPLTGYADGTFISAKPSADRFTRKVGADGEVGRARGADRTHEVTLTLLQVSPSNDYLSTVLAADALSNAGVLPLQIADLSGTTLQFWDAAWIKTPPSMDDGKEIADRQWVFDTGQIVLENIGGNL